MGEGLRFCDFLIGQPQVMILSPGTRHWSIFEQPCRNSNAKGNLVPDAYFAALAIEHGAEWITLDGDFARSPD